MLFRSLGADLELKDKEAARSWFYEVRQAFLDLNGAAEKSDLYGASLSKVESLLLSKNPRYAAKAQQILASLE